MRHVVTAVGLIFLAVAAVFVPSLLWVYACGGSVLLAAIFVHKHLALKRQVSQLHYEPRVFGSGRMRRFVRQVNTKGSKFWRLLPSTKVIACFVAVSIAALLVGAVIGANLVKIRNVGTIRAIGVDVYADEELSTILTEIAWGTLDPGETKTFDAWIKNTGNSPQKLVMWTENWIPTSAQDTISLTWNYDDDWIAVGASLPVMFTLSVDPNITGVTDFSFDVRIQGVA